ncbi:MAG TPA: YdcF family protein, partial [Planctomycetaceae bacterium]|nr:YdcF family protein [Planctomycetaceae bacterium]
PFAAAHLVRDGWAERILITQPVLTSQRFEGQPSEGGLTERILIHEGVQPTQIVTLPHDVLTTADEAEALAEFLTAHPEATVTVLTSRYHTRRAKLIFGRALDGRFSQCRFLGTPSDYFDESNWWRTEEGTRAYVLEYVKLAYNLVRQN